MTIGPDTYKAIHGEHLEVNGIELYYEIYGKGTPLVLIHGGGSTIQTSFTRIMPRLAEDFLVIAMDLANHGRSGHRQAPGNFQQDADDVAALLLKLGFPRAHYFGFSNGGHAAIELALRHPHLIDKLVLASSPVKRSGFMPGFFEGMQHASLDNMPSVLKEAFLDVNPDPALLQHMFDQDSQRMRHFEDWTEDQIRSIQCPVLLVNGDRDIITHEHAVEMHRLIPNSRLLILPAGHGSYMGELSSRDQGDQSSLFLPLLTGFLHS